MSALLVQWEDLRAGEQLGPIDYAVTAGAVEDFCSAVGIPRSAYSGLAGGEDAVPPTLTATDYTALLRGRLRPFVGMHAKQSLRFHRALPVGAAVQVAGTVVETYTRRGRNYLVLDYAVRDRRGLAYSSSRITTTIDGYTDAAEPEQPPATPRTARAAITTGGGRHADAAGTRVVWRSARQPISQEAMTRFALQPGLRFPFMPGTPRNHHTDTAVARQMGLPGTVAQSLQYCAFAAHLALDRLGPAVLDRGRLSFVFLRPVYAGDLLDISLGSEMGSETAPAGRCEVRCANQRGDVVATGTAQLGGDDGCV